MSNLAGSTKISSSQNNQVQGTFEERLQMYQEQKKENLEKLKKEMYKELTLKPKIPDTSKTMGISRATARGEDTTLNASERLFREAYEK